MFQRKYAPHMHTNLSQHTHAHQAHTHDPMYSNMYICTHCGRTGHLAKFCYDRIYALNFARRMFGLGKALTLWTEENLGTKIHSYLI